MSSFAESNPCELSTLTASSVPVEENAEVGMAKSEVLQIDKLQDMPKNGVQARLTPLKSTTEAELPAEFSISEVGGYSVDMLWTDVHGTHQSCTLLQRFNMTCDSKEGYFQQGPICVKRCESGYIPQSNECEAGASTDDGHLNLILGGLIGAVAAACVGRLLFLIRKHPQQVIKAR